MFSQEDILDLIELTPKQNGMDNLDDAYIFCKNTSLGHYENFPVGSVILPKSVRKHVFAIYTFSRIGDDIADENYSFTPDERIENLDIFLDNLRKVLNQKIHTTNPIFLALSNSIFEKKLPILPFEKLIEAFKMDAKFTEPKNFDDLLYYCSFSACPIGELILRLFGEYNEHTAAKSDAVTSALQLINFCQDLSLDIPKGRMYIPAGENLAEMIKYSQNLLNFGIDLPKYIKNRRLKFELKLIISAGLKIQHKIEKSGDKLYKIRPELTKQDYVSILLNSILWKY
ncbi:MAG: hypothetical protein A2X64_08775 [Ignavibacteria bacterium GWF2_33_9]|nr:MAG: hypothetical protein A2X64_08775 [Ignavibacteria bacterium GWF2_33_9]